ncbi:MAG: hypothetical protein M3R57_09050, partial [Chloroflexota bacterium]|nr:hypothetical protein [Chloroflexota bacterium]
AAASVFRFVAILCGIHATSGPSGSRLYVNPALPEWLPDLTLRNLRAGRGAASVRFVDGDVTVLANTTGFEIVHGPAPRPQPREYQAKRSKRRRAPQGPGAG